jgi:hypothetical protein
MPIKGTLCHVQGLCNKSAKMPIVDPRFNRHCMTLPLLSVQDAIGLLWPLEGLPRLPLLHHALPGLPRALVYDAALVHFAPLNLQHQASRGEKTG